MELLSAFVFCAVLLCSNAQRQPPVVSADCNVTEEDAGLALDLINKHRRSGYIFTLLRVADAHVQRFDNESIFYFTLDVLETECSVLSRRYWKSCELGPFFGTMDFGRCNAVVYIDPQLKGAQLYGYNCTMSPVPPKLYESKRSPVRITVLENVQQYTAEAERILEKYIQDSNQTNCFKIDTITRVILGMASRSMYRVEFTIKETTCHKAKPPSKESGCEFLPDRHARAGFCRGRVLNGTKGSEGVEVESCEIYDIFNGRPPFHNHHNDSGEHHPCCRACRHPWHKDHRPHHRHPHGRPHHRPHHHGRHHHPHHTDRSHRPHHHDHDHRPHRGHRRHRHYDCCGFAKPTGHSNSSKESKEKVGPCIPPPPGPHYPPPPPGGPHHFPPSRCPPPPGPPPPPGQPFQNRPYPHPPQGPDFHPLPFGPQHGYQPDHRENITWHERGGDSSSEEYDSLKFPGFFPKGDAGSVYRIPVENEQDVLKAPGADFPSLSPDSYKSPSVYPFPGTASKSESCPGKPKIDLRVNLLSLYPPLPKQ